MRSGREIIQVVAVAVVSDMNENKELIPEPIAVKNYSGKFVVRVSPEIHRDLAIQAAEAGISLNRIVNSKLSQ